VLLTEYLILSMLKFLFTWSSTVAKQDGSWPDVATALLGPYEPNGRCAFSDISLDIGKLQLGPPPHSRRQPVKLSGSRQRSGEGPD
jgi:hypothetical protein